MSPYSLAVGLTLFIVILCLAWVEPSMPSDEECKETSCETNHGTNIVQFPFMISPQDFYYSFVSKHKPVLLKRSAVVWPAFQLWTDNHIKLRYGIGETLLNVRKGLISNQQSSEMKMTVTEFFNRYSNEDLGIDDEVKGKALLQDITVPLCLRCEHFINKVKTFYSLRQSNTTITSNLCLNTLETLLVVLSGNVQLLLVSPLYAEKLYEDHDESNFVVLTEIKVTRDYLKENKVPFQIVKLQEGDMLYIPQMWWQQTILQPGRNLDVKFRWLTSLSIKANKEAEGLKNHEDFMLEGKFAKFGRMMKKYENLLQTAQPLPLRCAMQDKRMSEFEFETTKMSPKDYEKIHDGPDYREELSCSFDDSNLKSPCHAKVCQEDGESPECIKYSLEYCLRWEDHGCITDMPQILNKKLHSEFNSILEMESQYESDS